MKQSDDYKVIQKKINYGDARSLWGNASFINSLEKEIRMMMVNVMENASLFSKFGLNDIKKFESCRSS